MSATVNPWEPLGLPATWAPMPHQDSVINLTVQGPSGPEQWHVLVIATASGIQGYKFTADELRDLCEKALAQVSGLTLARTIPDGPSTLHA